MHYHTQKQRKNKKITWDKKLTTTSPFGHHILQENIFAYLLRPGIIPSCPNKIFPHDLVEHGISYLFGIVQLEHSFHLHVNEHSG